MDSAQCLESKYGEYDTLIEAKKACLEDDNCLSIYDFQCDEKDKYYLCPASKEIKSSPKSCLHRKK